MSPSAGVRVAHAVEVVGDFDLTFEEPEPLRLRRRVDRRDLHQRLPGFSDDELLPLRCAVYEARELRLRFVDVDGGHGSELARVD